jgi:cyclopropane-fatty-acyl-phospholipid synthase
MTITATRPSRVLSRLVRVGELVLISPSGTSRILRGSRSGPVIELTVLSHRAWLRIARGGALGFAEAYMLGEVHTPDLADFFVWGALNQQAFREGRAGSRFMPAAGRLWQRLARDLPHRNVGSTTDHYDLGNDFYQSWLDRTMSYSAARFSTPGEDLETAQRNKYASLARLAGIRPGDSILEIGCGWGGFLEYAAGELGCSVTGITLSGEMAAFARERLADLGLDHLVDVRVEDFRSTTGTFDRIVSVEMIESIDESQWPALFASMRDRLAPGGRVAMQAITINNQEWTRYRANRDFIQRYIFPGGQLPAPEVLDRLAMEKGFEVVADEAFGHDYAETLARWHERFERAWPRLAGVSFDRHFRLMWKLYLGYCEAGFRLGRIDVHQIAMRAI